MNLFDRYIIRAVLGRRRGARARRRRHGTGGGRRGRTTSTPPFGDRGCGMRRVNGWLRSRSAVVVLGALWLFIGQQDDIGHGNYTALDAFWFTLLNLPQQAYEVLPIGVLIGSLLGRPAYTFEDWLDRHADDFR